MNLGEVMDEVGDRLDAITGLRVYRYPPDDVAVPAAIVTYPEEYMYDETYSRGMDRMTLPVIVVVGKVSDRASRNTLSDWLDRSGAHRYTIDNISQMTKWTISPDGAHASTAVVADGYFTATLSAGTTQGASSLRDVYIHDNVTATDFHARTTFDPPFFGDPGPGNPITPQMGLILRYQRDTKQRGVTINNNVVFGVPMLNVGVWSSNLNGTGFLNRQYPGWPAPFGISLPYTVEARLRGNIVNVRQWTVGNPVPEWNDPVLARTINLDTDAGSTAGNETPVGEGGAGLICAHLGIDTSPLSACRFPIADTYFERDSESIKDTLEVDSDSYRAFDTLRATGVDFDVVQIAGIDYLAATFSLDIAGQGAA